MKKTVKKVLAMLMCLTMIFTVAPLSGIVPQVSAETTYSGTCGDNLMWSFDEETGVLDITGEGDMWDWDGSDLVPWNSSYITSIETINIGNGVTSIGSCAFADCENLVSVSIPNSVTRIAEYAFYSCYNLDDVCYIGVENDWYEIEIDEGNSCLLNAVIRYEKESFDSLTWDFDVYTGVLDIAGTGNMTWDYEDIPWYSFCSDIKTVKISDGITNIGRFAFVDCDNLTSIAIPDTVTSIESCAFENCTSLTNIIIPNSVTSIESAVFRGCTSLRSIRIPAAVTKIEEAVFWGCTNLTTVEIPDNVTSIGHCAFEDCTSLTNVVIPNTVTSIESYAFENCTSLTNIIIPNSVTSIESAVFCGCTSLTSVTIPEFVSYIGENPFFACTKLKYIAVSENNQYYSSDENGVLYNKDKTVLIQYPAGSTKTHFNISENVTIIEDNALYYCSNLEIITVDEKNENYSSDENGILFNKDKTELIKYPPRNLNTDYNIPTKVTSLKAGSFSDCVNLIDLTITDNILKNSYYWYYSFLSCTNLQNINISSDNELYSSQDGVVFNKGLTELVYCPAGRTSYDIPYGVTSIGDYAFYYCEKLMSITIPETVTDIGQYAFSSCNVDNIKIPNSMTGIGVHAFIGCGLKCIYIPKSVKNIGAWAFLSCDNLTDVYYSGSESEWYEIEIYNWGNECLTDATIHFDYDLSEHSHSYTSKITKEASCTETGIKTFTCECGDTYTEEIAKLSHSLTHKTVASTCETKGYEYDYCSSCKGEFNKVDLPLADHSTKHIKVDSTCKTKGYEYDECTVCGTQSNYKELPLGSHKNNRITVPSTCKVQGMEYDLCTVCGATSNTKVLPLADHSTKHIKVDSTCKTAGYEYDECSVCKEKLNYKDLPLADHTWSDWEVTTEPTTESEGVKTRKCSVCGETETASIPKLNIIADEETGIEIEYSDEYDTGIEIEVEEVYDGNSFQLIEESYGKIKTSIFDINTLKDGIKVQPSGKVKVRIPMPEEFTEGNNIFVCYVDSVNGTVENIPATVVDGYIEFEAEHFSYYAVVQHIGKVNKVTVNDFTVKYKDSYKIVPTVDVDENVDYTVTYTSSNTDIATVDKNGNITTTGRGSATITCTVTDEFGNEVKDTCQVEVKLKWWQWIIWIFLWGWAWY